ncbi:MAG: hypothetical protein LIO42_04065 [Oscillospiraceae bacterium]|nr:hypothetical protein [Oscillospiraceae bacterium]
MGYDAINQELWDFQEACDDVQYFIDNDDGTLLDALDGDDEEEFEFKMAFADLGQKCEDLINQLDELTDFMYGDWSGGISEYFDTCTVALIGNRYRLVGFDSVEEDYFSLCRWDEELATSEAGKRLMRETKKNMIAMIGQCFGILLAFQDLRLAYNQLEAVMDILRDQNRSLIEQMREVDAAYNAAAAVEFRDYAPETRRFDRLVEALPGRMWIE